VPLQPAKRGRTAVGEGEPPNTDGSVGVGRGNGVAKIGGVDGTGGVPAISVASGCIVRGTTGIGVDNPIWLATGETTGNTVRGIAGRTVSCAVGPLVGNMDAAEVAAGDAGKAPTALAEVAPDDCTSG